MSIITSDFCVAYLCCDLLLYLESTILKKKIEITVNMNIVPICLGNIIRLKFKIQYVTV